MALNSKSNHASSGSAGGKNPRGGRKPEVAVPSLGPWGMVRWAWTQLTSMRTALFLLLLLAVATVPGSLFPQRPVNPTEVTAYLENKPVLGEWLDTFQLFDVFSSVWFSAIYLLLFISLIGCVFPRAKKHYKTLRTPPPRTPARLSRLPENGSFELADDPAARSDGEVLDRSAALLRKRGYRVEKRPGGTTPSVAAERGYVREIGNLVFHFSLIGVLASVAIGGVYGYTGQRIVVEGESFVNTLVSYDSFNPGTGFKEGSLSPFSVALDDFDVTYDRESTTHFGQPIDFHAQVTTSEPGQKPRKQDLRVNHPLRIGGTAVYLVANGYAPDIVVHDGNGKVAYSGPVVAVPQDEVFTSLLVLKVPDAAPDQLGFVGLFLPTAGITAEGVGVSLDPSPTEPQLQLNSYYGDLGLDSGDPQNVFVLDTDDLNELNSRKLDAGGLVVNAGQTVELPQDKGTITFKGIKRYAALDVHHDPGKLPVGIFAALALMGLAVSLFTPRRRAWIKVHPAAGESGGSGEKSGRIIEYGVLARGEDPRVRQEAREIRTLLEREFTGTDRTEV
ncbi:MULTISPECIES: cytochrome c biogenesis protein ResB [unclassified Arthrobacter]|uniref:cytochrome c biogenesis protein ResB n=1 Tax=unclassified Arthrobacter TaxID=235627 RepID=UPI0040332055